MNVNDILVVFFSRTGYTRGVAQQIALALGARTCEITEARSRLGLFGYSRCLWEASTGRDSTIEAPRCAPRDAPLVVIGTPIWGWHLASPVRAFARRFGADIERCAFFCTMGGAGASGAFAELQRIVGQAPLATLALTDAEIDSGRAGARIEAYAADLQQALQAAASVGSGPALGRGTEVPHDAAPSELSGMPSA